MAFKLSFIGSKSPSECKENIPHIITPKPPPFWTVDTRRGLAPYIRAVYAKLWPYPSNITAGIETDQTKQFSFQSSVVNFIVILKEFKFMFYVLICEEWNLQWSPPVVADLLQRSTGMLSFSLLGFQLLLYFYQLEQSQSILDRPLSSTRNFRLQMGWPGNFFWPFAVNPRHGLT